MLRCPMIVEERGPCDISGCTPKAAEFGPRSPQVCLRAKAGRDQLHACRRRTLWGYSGSVPGLGQDGSGFGRISGEFGRMVQDVGQNLARRRPDWGAKSRSGLAPTPANNWNEFDRHRSEFGQLWGAFDGCSWSGVGRMKRALAGTSVCAGPFFGRSLGEDGVTNSSSGRRKSGTRITSQGCLANVAHTRRRRCPGVPHYSRLRPTSVAITHALPISTKSTNILCISRCGLALGGSSTFCRH